MKASDPLADQVDQGPRWLLIGNSRWHWAEAGAAGLRTRHHRAPSGEALAALSAPWAWAAVGGVPPAPALEPQRRLQLGDVPLKAAPPWLGIDRALAGWQAWRRGGGHPVLVVDAGTVLSLTRVDAEGRFAGGRLLAGVGLQLRAMAAGTAALPEPSLCDWEDAEAWPRQTGPAMLAGTVRGLVAAVVAAVQELPSGPEGVSLVLTGGDGPLFWPRLRDACSDRAALRWDPDLCLEALVALTPWPETGEAPGFQP